jgi:hypothetical protein
VNAEGVISILRKRLNKRVGSLHVKKVEGRASEENKRRYLLFTQPVYHKAKVSSKKDL